jgi:intracellular sulfur oxidation DsrE/DsrF family protein
VITNRRTFIEASAGLAVTLPVAAPVVAGAAPAAAGDFDRAAFEARLQLPFKHRQVFASPRVANGAVLGFMNNSLNAYDSGFDDGPGTLHAAAVLYAGGTPLAFDDAAWEALHLADVVQQAGDRIVLPAGERGNPFVRGPRGWTYAELLRRNASFFVCNNSLNDLARRTSTTPDYLKSRLLPGVMVVPAGVGAINALQEARFTLFQAAI